MSTDVNEEMPDVKQILSDMTEKALKVPFFFFIIPTQMSYHLRWYKLDPLVTN